MMLSLFKSSTNESHKSMQGFSLVDVMVGMMLTTILVTGLTGLWGMVSEEFFKLTLRQKAVFVLHGNMERVASLYRYTSFWQDNTTLHTDLSNIIHQTGTNGTENSNLFVTGLVYRETTDASVEKDDFVEGQVLYMDYSASNDINVVWLDRELDITAKMYWTLSSISSECYIDDCSLLTLYLEYPFRFSDLSDPVGTMWDKTETITLQTITGRR
ncbi:MAG: hypothetical protein HQL69_16970 [Magnetococcales bacterium]|nr:hypothetical protein [Magnetococcales bacterium]